MYNRFHARHRVASGIAFAAAAGLGVALTNPADAAVTFTYHFLDAPGIGFNASGSTGADRRAGLAAAGDYLAGLLVNYDANIELDIDGSITDNYVLASAGSNYNADYPGDGFGDRGDVMLKILGGDGADPSPGTADGEISWNFQDFDWEPLNDFQPGELDLISTAIHELTHAIGFVSSIFEDGSSYFDDAGYTSAWSPFDQYVADSSGAIISGNSFIVNDARWSEASVGGAGPVNGLLFNGPHAMAANGGNAVPLYSPTTWDEGSSGSHLDTDYFTGANAQLMNSEASVYDGLDIRTLSSIELAILQDIGYTLLVVNLPGDLDGDGFVGLADLDIILSNWNQSVPPGNSPADITGPGGIPDGYVGLDDLDVVLANWNAGTPPEEPAASVIPEPGAISLLGLGVFSLVRRRPC